MSPIDVTLTDDTEELDRKIVGITMHTDDYQQGIDTCRQFWDHEDEWVRRAVLEGLSHLVRVHGEMDLEFALELLRKGRADESQPVRGEARNTIDDFEVFIPGFTWEKYGFVRPCNLADLQFDDDDDDDDEGAEDTK